ncbi:sensor histidine kinase [Chondrinema litorale]|uniref:sensor histidine kinase n=1 Tax=Chondrinema litorale TaxID=2994555 RepID=UPI00254312F2|nr:sensor histidine kinase [Chondrinema litorale]UZR98107.1 ATP-binding protein [Chondrinema litorale]
MSDVVENILLKFAFISISLIILFFEVNAQNEIISRDQYTFRAITNDDGLSHSRVICVEQDHLGYIWIGTQFGLNMYDGYSFKTFREIAKDSTSIFGERINDILLDSKQNLWVATSKTVSRYDFENKNFIHFKRIPKTFQIAEDSKGMLWLTTEKGLAAFNPKTEEIKFHQHEPKNDNSIINNELRALLIDKHDNLWMGTDNTRTGAMGLTHYNPKTGTFRRYQHNPEDINSLCENRIEIIYEDKLGKIWIGTHDEGISIYNLEEDNFTNYKIEEDLRASNRVRAFAESYDGNFWVGTSVGLYLLDTASMVFSRYAHEGHPFAKLSQNSIQCAFLDSHNGMWLGTFSGGINYSSLFRNGFVNYNYKAFANEFFLKDESVNAFAEDKLGNLWIATTTGLNYLERNTELITEIQFKENNGVKPISNNINHIITDQYNNVWTANNNMGVSQYNPSKNSFKHYIPFPNNVYDSKNRIKVLCLDNDKNLWAGSQGTLLIKKKNSEKFIEVSSESTGFKNIPDFSRVNVLSLGNSGKLWVAGIHILASFDSNDKSFTEYNVRLSNNWFEITTLWEDLQGNVWIVWDYEILLRFDPDTQEIINYSQNKEMPNVNYHAILGDNDGNLWMSSNDGIVEFRNIANNNLVIDYLHYNKHENLQGKQFFNNSSYKSDSGELFFGGNSGFNAFYPNEIKPNVHTPIVIINKVDLNNIPLKKYEKLNKESIAQVDNNLITSIELDHHIKVFTLEFTGLLYTSSQDKKYKYFLEGFDSDWVDAGYKRTVTYTTLPPGDYTFKVKAANQDGIWNNNATMLYIKILPPWWNTTLAKVSYMLIVFCLAYTFYKVRVSNIKSQNKLLETLVKERTANLREMNYLIKEQNEEIQAQSEELEESYKEISKINENLEVKVEARTADLKKSNQELDNFVYRVSHDIRAPLSSVMGLVKLMEIEVDPIKLKEYLQMTDTSIRKLDGFVRDILDYSRNSRVAVKVEEIDFAHIIANTLEDLQYMQNAAKLEVIKEYEFEEQFYNDSSRINTIFRNLLSNAIKYQNPKKENPFLLIKVVVKNSMANIEIKDNGIGISEEYLEKVFEMFFRASEISVGSGIGLYIVKEAIDKLGGKISLESEFNKGTTFSLTLPNLLNIGSDKPE